MKRLFLGIIILSGLTLIGCTPGEPVTVTRITEGETAVPQNTIIVEATAILPASPATQTPTPFATPTNTPTPQPQYTPTFVPTPTEFIVPSPTPETVLLTPIEQVTVGQSLSIANDLLYINGGSLKLWEPSSGQVSTLLSAPNNNTLDQWQLSRDGRSILIVTKSLDRDTPGFILSLFDIESQSISEIWSEPDTHLLAYALTADSSAIGFITSPVSPWNLGAVDTIKALDITQGQVTTLADCPNSVPFEDNGQTKIYSIRCHAITAAPNGRSWLWNDIEGVWQGGLAQQPRPIVSHELSIYNNVPIIRKPTQDWSPDGRYQLLRGDFQEGGGSERFVLDMTTNGVIPLPNYDIQLEKNVQWLWTSDGRLAALREPYYEGEVANYAELWHVAGNELVLDAALTLPRPDYLGWGPAWALSQLADGRFAFALNHDQPSAAETRNIYLITSFDHPPEPLASLPPMDGNSLRQSLTWLPDDSGVLYIMPGYEAGWRPFYIPADGSTLYELTDLLGGEVIDMYADHYINLMWLP